MTTLVETKTHNSTLLLTDGDKFFIYTTDHTGRDPFVELAEKAAEKAVSARDESIALRDETKTIRDDAALIKDDTNVIKGAVEVIERNVTALEQETEGHRDAALDAKVKSETARDKARDWSEKTEDSPVDPGQFSSKHHASKSSKSADSSRSFKDQAEAARDRAEDAANKTKDAFVMRGPWDPNSGRPARQETNSMWYSTAVGVVPAGVVGMADVTFKEGDYLAFYRGATEAQDIWSKLTGDPLAPGEPQPLLIVDDIWMEPKKALRFKSHASDADPVYAVGMHKTKEGRVRLIYGDYSVDNGTPDVDELCFYIPDANRIFAVQEIDPGNDDEPIRRILMLNEDNGVTVASDQSITGKKTFLATIVGSITGNAGTVTNGVYLTGNQTINGVKTFTLPIEGSVTGNAATATNAENSAKFEGRTKAQVVAEARTGMTPDTDFKGHKDDKTIHITAAERTSWNGKLDRAGGTMSGGITIDQAVEPGKEFKCTAGDKIANAVFRISADGAFLGYASSATNWLGYLRVNETFTYTKGTSTYQVYHEGHKPTPAEIGALATGGTAANSNKLGNKSYTEVINDSRAGMASDAELAAHAKLTTHITSAERTSWNGKLDKTGGTVSGALAITSNQADSLRIDRGTQCGIRFNIAANTYRYLGVSTDGHLRFGSSVDHSKNSVVFHSGNYATEVGQVSTSAAALANMPRFKPYTNGDSNPGFPGTYGSGIFISRQSGTTRYGWTLWNESGNSKLMLGKQNSTGSSIAWQQVFTSSYPPTAAQVGASPSNHNHNTIYQRFDYAGNTDYARLVPPKSTWIRAPEAGGFLPYLNGKSNLGTSSWKWATAHISNVYCTLLDLGNGYNMTTDANGVKINRSGRATGWFGGRNADWFHLDTNAKNGFYSYKHLDITSINCRAKITAHTGCDARGPGAGQGLAYYGKTAIGGTNDGWLRLNPTNQFSSGIYCGSTGALRHDGTVSCGSLTATGSSDATALRIPHHTSWGVDKRGAIEIGGLRNTGSTATYLMRARDQSGRRLFAIDTLNQGSGQTRIWIGTQNKFFQFDPSGDFTAQGNVTAYSDRRVKDEIEQIENALDKVAQINGVTFTRKDEDDDRRHMGVIAQEVEKVAPEVVQEQEHDELGTIKTVAYGNMVGLLVEAIKELRAEVQDLRSQIGK